MKSRGHSPQRSPRREEGACEDSVESWEPRSSSMSHRTNKKHTGVNRSFFKENVSIDSRAFYDVPWCHAGWRKQELIQISELSLLSKPHGASYTIDLCHVDWAASLGCFSGACWWKRLNCWGPGSASDSRRRPWAGLMATFSITASHKPSWYNVCP